MIYFFLIKIDEHANSCSAEMSSLETSGVHFHVVILTIKLHFLNISPFAWSVLKENLKI